MAWGAEEKIEALKADMKFFTDVSGSELKESVKSKDLDGFQSELRETVATGLLNKTYDRTYRAASYEAYPSPRALGKP